MELQEMMQKAEEIKKKYAYNIVQDCFVPLKYNTIACPCCGNGTKKSKVGMYVYAPDDRYNAYTYVHFRCHSCGANYSNVIDLYADARSLSFSEALKELVYRYYGDGNSPQKPVEPPSRANEKIASKTDYLDFFKLSSEALNNNPKAKAYLESRGIPAYVYNSRMIGYNRNKIIIPCDRYSYVGRYIEPWSDAEGVFHRYHNSTGALAMFGLKQAVQADTVYVCEGIFDALSVITLGKTAISINGCGNCNKLLSFIRQFPDKRYYLMFDADDAGQELTAKVKKEFPDTTAIKIPAPYKDVNEWFTADREYLHKVLNVADRRR